MTNNAIRAMFVSSFAALLNKSKKECGYSRLEEKVYNAEKGIKTFREESGYNELIVNDESIIASYGEKFYARTKNELKEKLNVKLNNVKALRSQLKKADDKIAKIMSRKFDMPNLVSTFGASEAKDQYDEGLITFVEFASSILSLANAQ